MGEAISKVLIVIECVLFLAPLTFLAGFLVLAAIPRTSASGSDTMLPSAWVMWCAYLMGFALLLCAWSAALSFLAGGRAALARLSPGLIKALNIGAALPLLGLVALFAGSMLGLDALASAGMLAFGIPALVPYIHLSIERDAASRSGTSAR